MHLPRRTRVKGKRRRKVHPVLERLEQRVTPTNFIVNSTLDSVAVNLVTGQDASGHVTLRSALMAANATSGSNTIVLPAGTITLTLPGANEDNAETGDLDIYHSLAIVGQGALASVVNANQLDRVFQVFSGATVSMIGFTIQNGRVIGTGGGVANAGTLTLSGMRLSNNAAVGETGRGNLTGPGGQPGSVNGFGGAVYNQGNLEIDDTTLTDNTAQGGRGGTSSSFGSGGGGGGLGAGGALFNDGGTVNIFRSTLSANLAVGGDGAAGGPGFGGAGGGGGGAGGAGGDSGNPATIGRTGSFGGGGGGGGSGSSASFGGDGGGGGFGGGGGGGGSVFGSDSFGFHGLGGVSTGPPGFGGFGGSSGARGGGGGGGGAGLGGGIYNNAGTVNVNLSTISGNLAQGGSGGFTPAFGGGAGGDGGGGQGGGIFDNNAPLVLLNTTIADNTALGGAAGGIYSGSSGASNGNAGSGTGGGLANIPTEGSVSLSLTNTLLANNSANLANDFSGTAISGGHNLVGDPEGGTLLSSPGAGGDITGVQANLGPLQDNGGPTFTQALLPNSPAIDAADPNASSPSDQRGVLRLNNPDIGAYEFNPYAVTNTNDSGPGSLRQAILNADNFGGGQELTFDLPGGDTTIQPLSALPTITVPLVIDGTTQPGSIGLPSVQIDGSLAGSANGLWITSLFCTVRGLSITNFSGSGILLQNCNSDIISDNYIGTDLSGTAAAGNGFGISLIDSGFNTIGGSNAVAGNVISANTFDGILLQGENSTGNVINFNRIGSTADGNHPLGNRIGIDVQSSFNTIGDSSGADGNLIVANRNDGIAFLTANASNNIVSGNVIGLAADGQTPLGNAFAGIDIFSDAGGEQIGGTNPGQGNIIAYNGTSGVSVFSQNNAILSNSIFGNMQSGIDLEGTGNRQEPAPILTLVRLANGSLTIQFNVPSDPSSFPYPLHVEFFLADANGEGETLIGSTDVPASEAFKTQTFVLSGFNVTLPAHIVATSTDASENTSGFSAPVEVNVPPVINSITANTTTLLEGQILVLSGSFTDSNSDDTHTVVIQWGDNSSPTVLQLAAGVSTFQVSHAFLLTNPSGVPKNSDQIQVTVTDPAGGFDTRSLSVTVTNVPPQVVLPPSGSLAFGVGQIAEILGKINDPGINEQFSGTVNFGDDTGLQTLTIASDGTFVLEHNFAKEGTYTVLVAVSDSSGGTTTVPETVFVFLAPPTGFDVTLVPPGGTGTASTNGQSATLFRAGQDVSFAAIVVALLPNNVGQASVPNPTERTTVLTIDIRAIGVSTADVAEIVFHYTLAPRQPNDPVLDYLDPLTGQRLPVQGAEDIPNSFVIDRQTQTVTFLLDNHSRPTLLSTFGTVFTITLTVAPPAPAGASLTAVPTQVVQANVAPLASDAGGSLGGVPTTGFARDTEVSLAVAAVQAAGNDFASGGNAWADSEVSPSVAMQIIDSLAAGLSAGGSNFDESAAPPRGSPPQNASQPAPDQSVPSQDEANVLSHWRRLQDREIEEARLLWRQDAVPLGQTPTRSTTAVSPENSPIEANPVADYGIVREGAELNPYRLIEHGPAGAVLPTALFFATGIGFVLVEQPRPTEYPRRLAPPAEGPRKR
jgi:hypothetical protein